MSQTALHHHAARPAADAARAGEGPLARAARRIDDRANPVLVKELRQWLNSASLQSGLVILLAIEILATAFFFFFYDAGNPSQAQAGHWLFVSLQAIGLLFAGLFVPAIVAARIKQERQDPQFGLMIVAAGGRGYLAGKRQASLLVSISLYSTLLPFTAMAVLAGGVELVTVLWVTGADLVIIVLWATFLIAGACLPSLPLWSLPAMLLCIAGHFVMVIGTILLLMGLAMHEIVRLHAIPRTPEAWMVLAILALVAWACYRIAGGMLRPCESDRAALMYQLGRFTARCLGSKGGRP